MIIIMFPIFCSKIFLDDNNYLIYKKNCIHIWCYNLKSFKYVNFNKSIASCELYNSYNIALISLYYIT